MQRLYMAMYEFRDNSLLEIYPKRDELWVNGARLRGIHSTDRVVMLFLAVAALKWPGRSFRAKEVREEIGLNSVFVPDVIWPNKLTDGDIHTAVHNLRGALSDERLNSGMIESMSDRRIRLSIPLCNILILGNDGNPLLIPGVEPLILPSNQMKPKRIKSTI